MRKLISLSLETNKPGRAFRLGFSLSFASILFGGAVYLAQYIIGNIFVTSYTGGSLPPALALLALLNQLYWAIPIIIAVGNFKFAKLNRGAKLYTTWFLGQLIPLVAVVLIMMVATAVDTSGDPLAGLGIIIAGFLTAVYAVSVLVSITAGILSRVRAGKKQIEA